MRPEAGRLFATFEALANASRIQILERVASGATLEDLLQATGLERAPLEHHLGILVRTGLVRAGGTVPRTPRYALDPVAFLEFKEAVSGLGAARGRATIDLETRASPEPASVDPQSQLLCVVHGDRPGRTFAVGTRAVIGRDPTSDVPLAYDPFASAQHALVHQSDGRLILTDLESRNGTFVRFRRVGPGASVGLQHGDVISVGRTLLVFRSGA